MLLFAEGSRKFGGRGLVHWVRECRSISLPIRTSYNDDAFAVGLGVKECVYATAALNTLFSEEGWTLHSASSLRQHPPYCVRDACDGSDYGDRRPCADQLRPGAYAKSRAPF